MPTYYKDEMSTISTRQVAAIIRPSVFRKLSSVRLDSGPHSVVVKLEKAPWTGLVPYRTQFVCPNCGNTAQKLACIYGLWCCRSCVAWRNRGDRPRTRNRAPGRPPAKRLRIDASSTEPSRGDQVPKAPHLQHVDAAPGESSVPSGSDGGFDGPEGRSPSNSGHEDSGRG
jgi:hypothetical protein